MGELFRLTTGPTRVTGTIPQDAKDSVEVTAYERVELYLQVYEATGADPKVTVKVQTSMQNLSGDSALWHQLGAFTMVTSPNKTEVLSITSGMLRYLRWTVEFTGTTTAATFEVTGVARPG